MSEIDWSKAPEGATHYDKWLGSPFLRMIGFDSWEFWSENNECWLSFSNYTPGEGVTKRIEESWAGEGLPPVGTVCEMQHENWSRGWKKVLVLYTSSEYVITSDDKSGEQHWYTRNLSFRTVRTQAQIEAEERERAIDEMYAIVREGIYDKYALCSELYDAGFRKQGEAK